MISEDWWERDGRVGSWKAVGLLRFGLDEETERSRMFFRCLLKVFHFLLLFRTYIPKLMMKKGVSKTPTLCRKAFSTQGGFSSSLFSHFRCSTFDPIVFLPPSVLPTMPCLSLPISLLEKGVS